MQTIINYASLKTKLIKTKKIVDSKTVGKENNDIYTLEDLKPHLLVK
jgi:hypothetical protein